MKINFSRLALHSLGHVIHNRGEAGWSVELDAHESGLVGLQNATDARAKRIRWISVLHN